jgi:prepilin signal peptidase PulO-like enzyme (type II secretory pathway)
MNWSMAATPWIMISILIALVLFGVLAAALVLTRKKKHKPDYYAFFIMGLIWAPAGIAIGNMALSAMGFIFMIIGLVNKDKWKKNRRQWSKMDKDERMLFLIVIALLAFLALAGLVIFFLVWKGIII